ncbi:MAG: hypothetical protein R3D00_18900 [Bacteroidia bacterium]
MRLYLRPYQLFLIFAALVAMVFLLKINKRSFYFHYFRVIEEVELRNSQEMGVFQKIQQLEMPAVNVSVSQWIFFALFSIGILFLFRLSAQYTPVFPGIIRPPSRFHHNLVPVRAP